MSLAAAAASGLLVAASFPLGAPLPLESHAGWWPAAWIALLPLLLYCALAAPRPRSALACGFLTGLLGYGLILSWMIPFLRMWGHLDPVSTAGVFGILVGYTAAYVAFWALLVRAFSTRFGVPVACLLAPAAWTGLELARCHLLGGFPWALLGVSQHAVLTAIQIADVTGVYGVSFVLVAASSLLCLLVSLRNGATRGSVPCAAALALAVALPLTYGTRQPTHASEAEPVEAALIQANVRQSLKWDPAERDRIEQDHDRMTREASTSGASLILWSESSVPTSITRDADFAGRVERLAAEIGSEIVLGSVAYEQEGEVRVPYNSAFLVRPDTGIAGRYDKRRLVPFGEYVPLERFFYFIESVVSEAGNFRPGTAPTVLRARAGALGPLICYEAVFPSLSRTSARAGATLLVNLTNDAWYAGTAMPAQHLAHAVFRAVETRRFLLRCANTGISAVVDPRGAVTERTAEDETAVLRTRVTPSSTSSAYVLLGDAFAVACAIVSLLVAAHACCAERDVMRLPRAYPKAPEPRSHGHA